MRVITWNMGMAQRDRQKPGLHDRAWHYLLGLGPDLAFLQEALPPAWVRGEGTLVHGPFTQWGSLVFSPRFPLEPFRLPEQSRLRRLGSYLAYAVASLPDGSDAFVASVHAPAREATPAELGDLDPAGAARPSARRPRVNDLVFMRLDELVRDWPSFLVAGDWNTARQQGSEHGRRVGQEFFDRASENGWYDCVWEKLRKEVQTWFRQGDHLRQDDHAFCDQELGRRLREPPWVAADAATALGLSDHAPLILDFEIPPISMARFVGQPD